MTLVVLALLFAVIAGSATALVGPLATVVFAGVVIGTVTLLLPLPWLVVALVVMSFIVTGQLTYFARIERAAWFPFLIGALLLIRFPLDRMLQRQAPGIKPRAAEKPLETVSIFIALFLATLTAATLINQSPPLQVFISSKHYVFLWGLYLPIAASLVKPDLIIRTWALLPWLMPLQLPLIFYQRFVVMRSRGGTDVGNWDAVVGAFGGDPLGGGASGAMGLFCIIGIVTSLVRWRLRLMPGWHMVILVSAGIVSLALAEIKFVILLLPFAFALAFLREISQKPGQSLLLIIVGFIFAFGVAMSYKLQYGQTARGTQTIRGYVENMFKGGNTEADFVNVKTGEIGRVASLVHWSSRHTIREPMPLLLGHGAGSSRVAALAVGEAQKGYGFRLTRSSLGTLLWEAGLVGTLAYFGILGSAYLALSRRSAESSTPREYRATASSMAVALAVLMASIPYDHSLLAGHQMIVLLMLCLGYAVMSRPNRESIHINPANLKPA